MAQSVTPTPKVDLVGESYIEQQDRLSAERYKVEVEAKTRQYEARMKLKRDRWYVIGWVSGGLILAVFILALGLLIWQGNKGPSAKDQLQQQKYEQCVANHGSWIPNISGSDPLCIAQGQQVQK